MTTEKLNPEDMTDDQLEAAENAAQGEPDGHNPTVGGDDGNPAGDAGGAADAGATTAAAEAADDEAAAGTQSTEEAAAGGGADDDAQPGKVAGVASKDGTRVLPYAALQVARRQSSLYKAELDDAKQELEDARQLIADLKAGKQPMAEVTEADVAEMEANFPEQGAKMRALFEKAQAAPAPTKRSPSAADVEEDPVQEAIDQVPLLAQWQLEDGEKFERAQAYDKVLADSPLWRDKPAVDRFNEVVRLTAKEFNVSVPDEKSSSEATPPAKAADPKAAASQAQRQPPNTLSDFKGGGAVKDAGANEISKMEPAAMLGRFSEMTDAEIDAHLARHG